MPNWEEIQHEWETTKITLAALAKKHDVPLGTLKSRKSRDKNDGKEWMRGSSKKDATIQRDATPKTEKDATESEGVSSCKKKNSTSNAKNKRQSNRSGNPNPKNQFTERNSAALKHGLFSRYIPKETLEIMGMMDKDNPADLIWDQIMIQYAAIIRAQEIMFVEDKNDITKVLKKNKPGMFGDEKEWEFQFAWDKQANFLNAQSRAMGEFRSLIRQFIDMAHDDDERLLRLEQMQLSVDKSKVELEYLQGGGEDDSHERMQQYLKAIGTGAIKSIFEDKGDTDAKN